MLEPLKAEPKFKVGDRVAPKKDPKVFGIILVVARGTRSGLPMYTVSFPDDRVSGVYFEDELVCPPQV